MTTFTSRRADRPVDLIDFAGDDGWLITRNGRGCAGRGVADRVDSRQVLTVLESLSCVAGTDTDAPGPRAIGARPFRPEVAWDLVIPATQFIIDDAGQGWIVEIDVDERTPPARHGTPIGDVQVSPVDTDDDWCAAVAAATTQIRAGRAEKAVLAREVRVESTSRLSPSTMADRLVGRFANCFVFSVDGLVGASPELLVERRGEVVAAHPMAGTTRRSDDARTDAALLAALMSSTTYRHEHQVTIDMVHDTLLRFASYVDYEPEPSIFRLSNVAHLATRVEGRLSEPAADILELVDALHPTPAVSGRPRAAALAMIAELEPRDRGRYAGTVGWVDATGDGTWAVTLRCAQLDPDTGRSARLHAGCGLVGDSDPLTELAESEAKLQAALSALLD